MEYFFQYGINSCSSVKDLSTAFLFRVYKQRICCERSLWKTWPLKHTGALWVKSPGVNRIKSKAQTLELRSKQEGRCSEDWQVIGWYCLNRLITADTITEFSQFNCFYKIVDSRVLGGKCNTNSMKSKLIQKQIWMKISSIWMQRLNTLHLLQ